jgi:hypothetical protein
MAVTSAQIVDFLLANPGLSDAEIVSSMETYGVSPAQMAAAVGLDEGAVAARAAATIPEGQAKLLGDTWVQPVYQVIGSGEDRQVGGIENVLTYKTTGGINDAVATGTDIQYYSPTGEYQQTTQTQPVAGSFLEGLGEALTDPVVLAALAGGYGAGLFGGAGALGGAGVVGADLAGLSGIPAGTGALTAAESAALLGTGTGTGTGLAVGTGTGVGTGLGTGTGLVVDGAAGLGGGTGLTVAGAGGLGGATGVAGLEGALGTGLGTGVGTGLGTGTGTGLIAGTGLTGTGVLLDSTLGTGLLGTGTGALTGTGILTGSGLGTTLLGTGTGTGVTGALTTGVGTGLATGLGTGALTTGVGTGLGTGLATVGTGVGTGLGTGVGTGLATGLTNAAATGLGGLTAAQIGALLSGALTTGGGLLQQQTSAEAARLAQARIDAETVAAKQAAAFRPVGMTTRFGTSQFQIDPRTGQLTSAGYTLSPEAKAQQDRLIALSNAGLTQAEGAQAQFAPLQTGAQSLFGLGQGFLNAQNDPRLAQIASQYLAQSPESQRLTALGGDYLTQSPESKLLTALGSQYIAQSPQEVAQNYLNQQMALLQPSRELELANLQNKLQQQGRGGLAVAQGGAYGATTPELQALYNARAMQEAQLAANAQQAGQQQVTFGAGLVGTGQQLGIQGQQFGANLIGTGQQLGIQGQQFGMDTLARQQALEQQRIGFGSGLFNQGAGLMGQYYAGQQAAYAPYTTAMGQVQNLETLGQQPLALSTELARLSAMSGANVGQLGLKGAEQSVALATGKAATTNPYATLLGGLGSSPAFGTALGGLFL